MKVITPLSHLFWSSASVPVRSTDHTHVLGRGRGGEAVRVGDSNWKRGGLAQACREINEGHVEGQHRPLAPSLPRGRLTNRVFCPCASFFFFKIEMNQYYSNVSVLCLSETPHRVGVVMAWSGGDRWLSGLLDHRGVWGTGAGRPVQQPLSTTTDTGQHFGLVKYSGKIMAA